MTVVPNTPVCSIIGLCYDISAEYTCMFFDNRSTLGQ